MRSIIFVATWPFVQILSVNGVTSSRRTSVLVPNKIPDCTAAPKLTHSSGFILLFGSIPKIFFTNSWIHGMRVCPPTKRTSSTLSTPASTRHFLHGSIERLIISSDNSSSFARVNDNVKCFAPVESAVINGKLMSYILVVESAHFAFSHSSLIRCIAIGSFVKSIALSFLNSSQT